MASTTESRIRAERKIKAVEHARLKLVEALERIGEGYAGDMVAGAVADASSFTLLECGDLFRTLVLDEGWNTVAAGDVYNAATTLVEHACPSNA